ncbi:hypothetical protein HDV00_000206 [Rhizophlyctis rosea]|nr:hypothetical protein HDV00_000206 [Rhizophlyctis rosea]
MLEKSKKGDVIPHLYLSDKQFENLENVNFGSTFDVLAGGAPDRHLPPVPSPTFDLPIGTNLLIPGKGAIQLQKGERYKDVFRKVFLWETFRLKKGVRMLEYEERTKEWLLEGTWKDGLAEVDYETPNYHSTISAKPTGIRPIRNRPNPSTLPSHLPPNVIPLPSLHANVIPAVDLTGAINFYNPETFALQHRIDNVKPTPSPQPFLYSNTFIMVHEILRFVTVHRLEPGVFQPKVIHYHLPRDQDQPNQELHTSPYYPALTTNGSTAAWLNSEDKVVLWHFDTPTASGFPPQIIDTPLAGSHRLVMTRTHLAVLNLYSDMRIMILRLATRQWICVTGAEVHARREIPPTLTTKERVKNRWDARMSVSLSKCGTRITVANYVLDQYGESDFVWDGDTGASHQERWEREREYNARNGYVGIHSTGFALLDLGANRCVSAYRQIKISYTKKDGRAWHVDGNWVWYVPGGNIDIVQIAFVKKD